MKIFQAAKKRLLKVLKKNINIIDLEIENHPIG